MKYIYSTSQISKLSLTLHTFSITGSVAGLFLPVQEFANKSDIIWYKFSKCINITKHSKV